MFFGGDAPRRVWKKRGTAVVKGVTAAVDGEETDGPNTLKIG